MENPLISVVMPVYNAEKFLMESVGSIQEQTYENWELLLIDDASADNSAHLIDGLAAKDSRIKPHHLPTNQGAGFARNIGIKASRGDFICFLDSDDLWKPEKLNRQLSFMQVHGLGVSYSSYELIKENGIKARKKVRALKKLSYQKLQKANYIGNLTGMYSVEKLGKIYCPLIRKRQDWGLWLLALQKAGYAKGIEETLAYYRLRKASISGNKFEMLQYNFQVYHKVLGYPVFHSWLKMINFLWEQFLVKNKRVIDLNH